MNTRIHQIALAGTILAGATLAPHVALADVRICTFPGSPTTGLDRKVALSVFDAAGIKARITDIAFDEKDDDGVSAKELREALAQGCDVIAGFPVSVAADASDSKLLFSRGYLRSGYVSVALSADSTKATTTDKPVVAAMYASPAQLIAVQETGVAFELTKNSEQTLDAVASGRAAHAIVWYPAVVAYTHAHPSPSFRVTPTRSPYSDWQLTLAFDASHAALRERVNAALSTLNGDGSLARITHDWSMPRTAVATSPAPPSYAYRDGPAIQVRANAFAVVNDAFRGTARSGFIKVDASTGAAGTAGAAGMAGAAAADSPPFSQAQVTHGKKIYSSACAKCHGADLQGLNAPALRGPAFAPAANAHLTIGGVFGYMQTNMPADRPGKLQPQDYADIMAFLLYSNGYTTSSAKLTADSAKASTTPLNGHSTQ